MAPKRSKKTSPPEGIPGNPSSSMFTNTTAGDFDLNPENMPRRSRRTPTALDTRMSDFAANNPLVSNRGSGSLRQTQNVAQMYENTQNAFYNNLGITPGYGQDFATLIAVNPDVTNHPAFGGNIGSTYNQGPAAMNPSFANTNRTTSFSTDNPGVTYGPGRAIMTPSVASSSGGFQVDKATITSNQDLPTTTASASTQTIFSNRPGTGPGQVPISMSPASANEGVTTDQGVAANEREHVTPRLPIDNRRLTFNSLNDAMNDRTTGREHFTVPNDDWQNLRRNADAQGWVKRMVDAFGEDYLPEPTDPKRQTDDHKEYFANWQRNANCNAVTLFRKKGQDYLEKCCWGVLQTVIEVHDLGARTTDAQWKPDKKSKASARLAKIVELIGQYALIRLGILQEKGVSDLVTNPTAFMKRKEGNCWNNWNRPGAKKAARKRMAAQSEAEADEGDAADAEAEDEEDPVEQSEPQLPSQSIANVSSTLSTSQPLGVETGMTGNGSGTARPSRKRARSKTPEDSGVKRSHAPQGCN